MPSVHRPNILLCLFDSLSTADSGLIDSQLTLPAIAGLRDKSTFFTHVYAPCPESSPARASLFTGLDPCVHGLWTNGVAMPATEQSFAHRLLQAGYTNWLIGRRQLAGMSQWTSEFIRAGEYTDTEWAHGPLHRSRQNAYLVWLQQQSATHYQRIFERQANPAITRLQVEQQTALAELPDILSFNHWVGERVVQRIAAHDANQPFLAVAGFSVGSTFGAEPANLHDGESVHRPALLQADAAIGSILEYLSSKNLSDDTLVLVTAGRGNWPADTTDEVAAGCNNLLGERTVRVPLILYRPKHGNTVVDEPISTLDIAPTIIEAAGLQTGPRMQGHSLLRVLDTAAKPQGWAMSRVRRNANVSSERLWQSALRIQELKLVVTHANPHTNTPAHYQLFDLEHDPLEQHDLAPLPAHAETLEHMIDQMIDARCALEDRTEPRIAEF